MSSNSKDNRELLRRQLEQMHPHDFEHLVGHLLTELGYGDVEVTQYVGDGGIDLRARRCDALTDVQMAIQVKRLTSGSVGTRTIRELRGALGQHEQGLIITLSHFTKGAIAEASTPDRKPISLVDGDQLLTLLVDNDIDISSLHQRESRMAARSSGAIDQTPIRSSLSLEPQGRPYSSAASKVKSVGPLPGGASAGKGTLEEMLQYIDRNEPTTKQSVEWILAEFGSVSTKGQAERYWRVPRRLNLIEVRGQRFSLTSEGTEFLDDPSSQKLLHIFIGRIACVEEMMMWLTKQPHTEQQLLDRAREELGMTWDSLFQVKSRLKWLEALWTAKKTGSTWSAT